MAAIMARRAGRLRRIGFAAAIGCVGLVAGLAVRDSRSVPDPAPLSSERAGLAARQAEVAFADAQAVWAALFAAEARGAYREAQLRHFSRAADTTCAGGAAAVGPYHCPDQRLVGMDLATLDALAARMRGDAETGVSLFVGRIAAAHAAAELGLDGGETRERAERGDCLAGVWAHHAAGRLGAPTAILYGRTLAAARDAVAAAAGPHAGRADAALFAPGAQAGREAAFGRGLSAGVIAACG